MSRKMSAAPSLPHCLRCVGRCSSAFFVLQRISGREYRKPSIRTPPLPGLVCTDMQETIDETLDFFLRTVDLTDKPS
ncbi:hypothetical protein DJICPGNB_10165 [Escherichia coli]|nr:hypothetical protein DJICPGNB_10165 [Escherichia coli]